MTPGAAAAMAHSQLKRRGHMGRPSAQRETQVRSVAARPGADGRAGL